MKAFKKSDEGAALKKEMVELKAALKEHVKVSDVPESWKKEMALLKIEVSKAGQKEIEGEVQDVMEVGEKIKHSAPVQNLGMSLEKWSKTPEAKAIEALDKKFLASPEGKRLIAEWTDFGKALEANIVHTENGIHIHNSGMDQISDELNDVAHQYEMLEGSKWDKAYHAAWAKATTTPAAEVVGANFEAFKKSNEAAMLKKEVKEVKAALKKHVKVSDIPEEWKKDMNLLKVHVTDSAPIEKEWNDVEATWNHIKSSQPVRNMESSLHQWVKTPEVEELAKLDAEFKASPEGKRLV